MIQHSKTRTLLKCYLSRRVTADTQAIVRGLEPQGELMRAAYRMSRWRNPRRPWKLTTEQSLSVNEHPRIRGLIQRRAKLKGKASLLLEHNHLGRKINNDKQCLRYALRIEIRKKWDMEQAVIDIERQLSGLTFSKDMKGQLESSVERTPETQALDWNDFVVARISARGQDSPTQRCDHRGHSLLRHRRRWKSPPQPSNAVHRSPHNSGSQDWRGNSATGGWGSAKKRTGLGDVVGVQGDETENMLPLSEQ